MDSKITLSFDQQVIEQAKEFAAANNISLSRLTEFLLSKVISCLLYTSPSPRDRPRSRMPSSA